VARGERRRNLARLREIAQVAARHGFGYLFDRGEPEIVEPAPDEVPPSAGGRGARLRSMLEELGPTFVKFGQLLSTRPDVVPPDIVSELRGLQDDVRPMPFDQARAVIESELGLTLEQAFVTFEERPMASASIGQVHRATLPGGRDVVVKVQRAGAEETLAADIQLLYQAARVMKERVKRLEFIDLVGLVDEFARSVRQELDYRVEASHAEVFRRNFAGDHTVRVPRVYWRQTTSRVLTLELLDGVPLAHADLTGRTVEERRTLANRVAETWMKMVFVHGYFHADPHPANIIVFGPDQIGLVDFGLIGQLSRRDRQAAVGLFLDIVGQDFERLPRRLRELGVRYPRDREEEFREQLGVILQRYYGVTLSEIDAREILHEILELIYRLNIELPARWVMLDKALATLAGVGLEIYPDFNVFETAQPYARRLVTERLRPDRLAAKAWGDSQRYAEAFLEYPFQVSELLSQVREGDIEVTINLHRFEDLVDKAQVAVNRVALSVVAGAAIVAAAIVGALVHGGPHLFGVSLWAIPGLLAGVVLSAWFLVGLVRSGRW
jgi:ubiquinone biosynthesis protein